MCVRLASLTPSFVFGFVLATFVFPSVNAVAQPHRSRGECTLEIGRAVDGKESALPVRIMNTGSSVLRVLGLGARSSRRFSIRNVDFPFVLQPGESRNFQLVSAPGSNRPGEGERVTLWTSRGSVSAAVKKWAGGFGSEALILSPRRLQFGDVPQGTSVTKNFTLTNNGTERITITSVSIKGSSASAFRVTGISPPIELPPGHSLASNLSFAPKMQGPDATSISISTASGDRSLLMGYGVGVKSNPGGGTSGGPDGKNPGGASSGSDNSGASAGQTSGPGGPPDYALAETNASIIPIASSEKASPPWLSVSAGKRFTGKFGTKLVQYTRVTDANTYRNCNPGVVSGHGFMLTSGSGDEVVFNADDTLLTVHDGGNNPCFFALDSNPASSSYMTTSYLWSQPGQVPVEGAWSQTNKYRWYGWAGPLFRYNFLPCANSTVGFMTPCAPGLLQVYDYVANCDAPVPMYVNAAGIGASDTVFAVHYSAGVQGTGTGVFAYNSSANACYKYDTENMTVKSHVGSAGSPGNPSFSGAVSCDGVSGIVTWESGNYFETATGAWSGSIITIAGARYTVRSVDNRTTLRVYGPCQAGTDLRYRITPGIMITGGSMAQDSYYVHNVKMNPTGQWVVVSSQTCVSAASGACASYPDPAIYFMWHIGTNTVIPCNPINCQGGHWTESADYFLNIPDGKLHYRAFAGAATDDHDFGAVTTGMLGSDVHPSNKNDPSGANRRPVIGSNYAPEPQAWAITNPLSNEVLGWQQVAGGPLLRFGHTYNSTRSSNFPTQYAIGAPSSTGRFYAFTTDGEGTISEGSEVWLMRLH